jgi:ferredoxin-NADP reductase
MGQQAKQFMLPFVKKEQLAKDTFSFYFDRRESDFDFLPGQYIRLVLPHDLPDDRGTSRFFTISSSPLEKETIRLTTKLPQSTFKKTLFTLKSGYPASFFGPMGRFVLDEQDLAGHVFISGGIGITPFYSMVKYADEKKLSLPIALFAFFSEKEDMVFYDELMKVSKSNPYIQVIYSSSKPHQWDIWLEKHVGDWEKWKYYIVGAPGMVAQTRELLENSGLSSEQIITEDFTGY